jgi:hypothetical protein
MSIIAKIKQFFGIGGVDVSLAIPSQVPKASRVIDGQIQLTAKSDQHILSIEVKLMEDFSSGRGDDEETREFELGVLNMNQPFDIKAGETRTVPFRLPFEILKSNADKLKEKGGALGALGKVAAFANAEESSFKVTVEVDVKDTGFDPSASKEIELT